MPVAKNVLLPKPTELNYSRLDKKNMNSVDPLSKDSHAETPTTTDSNRDSLETVFQAHSFVKCLSKIESGAAGLSKRWMDIQLQHSQRLSQVPI